MWLWEWMCSVAALLLTGDPCCFFLHLHPMWAGDFLQQTPKHHWIQSWVETFNTNWNISTLSHWVPWKYPYLWEIRCQWFYGTEFICSATIWPLTTLLNTWKCICTQFYRVRISMNWNLSTSSLTFLYLWSYLYILSIICLSCFLMDCHWMWYKNLGLPQDRLQYFSGNS